MQHSARLMTMLMLVTICTIATNGQERAQTKSKPANDHTRIIKTQGTGPYDNVHCGIQDRSGALWLGTTGEGVYRYDGKTFTNFTTKDGLCNNKVWCILEDRSGAIWFGTDEGICRYKPARVATSEQFERIQIAITNSNLLYITGVNPRDRIIPYSMMQDRSGKIWVGTDHGVYCYGNSRFTPFLKSNNVMNSKDLHLNMVQTMLEDRKGNIWFTTWFDGICRYDGKTLTNFMPNNEVWYSGMAEDRNGNIWVGRREHGVCRYDGKTFTNIVQHGVLDSCAVGQIAEDKKGNIWFCTEYGEATKRESLGGVWRYDPAAAARGAKAFTNFTTKEGVSNNAVFCVTVDRTNRIWVGTRNMGLCRYDGRTFTDLSEKSK